LLGASMTFLGVPIAIVASVAALRTPGQLGWGATALVISGLEGVGLLLVILHEMGVL
jgi:hypothetical protein